MERHILIVDDEVNILNSLERLLEEQDDLIIHRANSGPEGLTVIDRHPEIGVVLSDQRMPNMNGTEFLKQVKQGHQNVVRMILSGYSDLTTITQAINEGSIFKFVTKPWEEDLLLKTIAEAFNYFELSAKNRQLTAELQTSNQKLAQFNSRLEQRVLEKTRNLELHIASLKLYHDAIEYFPFGMIGIDNAEMIVFENRVARRTLSANQTSLLGLRLQSAFTGEWTALSEAAHRFIRLPNKKTIQLIINNQTISMFRLGSEISSIGALILVTNEQQRSINHG